MSFPVWNVIWIIIGGLYGILAIAWGFIVWRGRLPSLDLLLPAGGELEKMSRVVSRTDRA